MLMIGLITFLREIFIATANLRIGPHDLAGYRRSVPKRRHEERT
jgi:hypothetical protein